jgi:Xaa-Pro aminopeptidase
MGIAREEYQGRVERLRRAMRGRGLDAVVAYSDEYRTGNTTYLTDYKPINVIEESPQVILLVEDRTPVVLIGRLNSFAAKAKSWIADIRPIHRATEFLPDILAPVAGRAARIGLIGDNLMPVSFFEQLRAAVPKAEFIKAGDLMIGLRQIKSPAEIDLMEKAADINDAALREVLKHIRVGQTEIAVAGEAEYIARQMGADFGSATVIMSGPNTDFPAWRPSLRALQPGDFVMVDFNSCYEHYCNDGGITVLLPGARPEQAKALLVAHRTLKEVVPALRPHMKATALYHALLQKIEAAGYADAFVPYTRGLRGVGHGVGLDVVEPPNLGPDTDYLLEPGMTLAVKLDLHGLPGGGLRVEVVVAITEAGVRPLNKLVLQEPEDFAILH